MDTVRTVFLSLHVAGGVVGLFHLHLSLGRLLHRGTDRPWRARLARRGRGDRGSGPRRDPIQWLLPPYPRPARDSLMLNFDRGAGRFTLKECS